MQEDELSAGNILQPSRSGSCDEAHCRQAGALTFTLKLSREEQNLKYQQAEMISKCMSMWQRIRRQYVCQAEAHRFRRMTASGGDTIRVEKADEVIILTAATDYFGKDPAVTTSARMEDLAKRTYSDIKMNILLITSHISTVYQSNWAQAMEIILLLMQGCCHAKWLCRY